MEPAETIALEAPAVLGKALVRVAERLDLPYATVAEAIGVSEATMSRLRHGQTTLDPKSKEGELGLLLVRVFRSLDALVGGSEEKARAWFYAHNEALGGAPAQRIERVEGLIDVLQYLDAMRAKT